VTEHAPNHAIFRVFGQFFGVSSVRQSYLFTSESVSEGHPDKVCDRISDEIVDLVFKEAKKTGMDPSQVRIACETLATTNRVIIAGEVRVPETLLKKGKDGKILHDASGAPIVNPAKFKSTARKAIKAIGYEQAGFHWKKARIDVLLHGETPELLPAPIYYAHKILEILTEDRKSGVGAAVKLGPDAKSQVTVKYENGVPVGVTQIVVSTQHVDASLTSDDVRKIIEPYVRQALPEGWIGKDTVWHVNPTGKFVVGGPDGDAGLTGRKIIVDTYGGAAPHGGGAFSGKDPTKVDRSAAYAARYLAKNVVAAGLADRATIQLSYAIGVAKPLSVYVDLHGTGKVDEAKLEGVLSEVFDLSPRGIRNHLQLNKPIYAKTSAYGHFGRKPGRDGSFSWEKIDLVPALKAAVKAA
jgi:S-adenosylmethionine synthetase